MWVMTHFGILMPGLRPAGTVQDGDTRLLQIRTRRAWDIDYLREHYQPDLGPTINIPGTDYQFRAYCTHESWANALARLALEIDYVKFKETTDRHEDDALHRVYNRIWSVVLSAFDKGSVYEWKPAWKAQQTSSKSSRRKRKAAKKQGKPEWRNAFIDVGEVDHTSSYNEFAGANPGFRKNWWEDI